MSLHTSSTRDHSVDVTSPLISLSPITLPGSPARGEDLEVRVSAPARGNWLPIIVLAHGYESSADAYAPLVNFWAARGFAVIQPTFLDSRKLALAPDDPRTPAIWQFRVSDMKQILDSLDRLEDAVPGLKGRLDRDNIAAVGHSFGGQTVGMLLGARVVGSDGEPGEDMSDDRIKVGVLLSTTGTGGPAGANLSPMAAEHFPFMNASFVKMVTPSLVVAGDKDQSPLTTRGPDWFTDAYTTSPGANALVTLFGGEHLLGGISGDRVTETTDENPARVAAVQRMTWAYLRSAFDPKPSAWTAAVAWLTTDVDPQGSVQTK